MTKTAHELWTKLNEIISDQGFENLDFKRNLGHSIEKNLEARSYIEKGNLKKLEEFGLFTFEPHIRKIGGKYGFRNENIYFFAGSKFQPI